MPSRIVYSCQSAEEMALPGFPAYWWTANGMHLSMPFFHLLPNTIWTVWMLTWKETASIIITDPLYRIFQKRWLPRIEHSVRLSEPGKGPRYRTALCRCLIL